MSGVFFGIQLAVSSGPSDPWRQKVRALLLGHDGDLDPTRMQAMWLVAADLLVQALPRVSLGYWDYVLYGRSEYDEWVAGIEDDAKEKWDQALDAETTPHALVSMLFLVGDGTRTAHMVGEACDIPPGEWNDTKTYRHLLEIVKELRATDVSASAMYVTPGSTRLAFSLRELRGDGYDYLRDAK